MKYFSPLTHENHFFEEKLGSKGVDDDGYRSLCYGNNMRDRKTVFFRDLNVYCAFFVGLNKVHSTTIDLSVTMAHLTDKCY